MPVIRDFMFLDLGDTGRQCGVVCVRSVLDRGVSNEKMLKFLVKELINAQDGCFVFLVEFDPNNSPSNNDLILATSNTRRGSSSGNLQAVIRGNNLAHYHGIGGEPLTLITV